MAGAALCLFMKECRFQMLTFRIGTPWTMKRTAHKKYHTAYPLSIMGRKAFNLKYPNHTVACLTTHPEYRYLNQQIQHYNPQHAQSDLDNVQGVSAHPPIRHD